MNANDVLVDFLMQWDIEEFGTAYTVDRMIEHLERSGFKIVAIEQRTKDCDK